MATTNPTAALRPRVTRPSDVRRLVQTLGLNPFEIDIHLYKEKMDVKARVYPSPDGRHEIEFPGRRRRVGLKKMVTTAAEEAARKTTGANTTTPQPAPAPSPTSATVPTPKPTPAPAAAPASPTTPAQPAAAPAIPTTPVQPRRKTPKSRKKKSIAAPLLTLVALMAVAIGAWLGWLLVSSQANNDTAASAKQQSPAATSIRPPAQPPTVQALLVEDYSTNLGDSSFEIVGSPDHAIEVVPPDDWHWWNKECVANCDGGEMVAFKLLGKEEFGGFYPATDLPTFGNNLQPRASGKNTTWQMKFVCSSGGICPTIRFTKAERAE